MCRPDDQKKGIKMHVHQHFNYYFNEDVRDARPNLILSDRNRSDTAIELMKISRVVCGVEKLAHLAQFSRNGDVANISQKDTFVSPTKIIITTTTTIESLNCYL